ncbi:MAG: lysophospholipid acyltransferase family protein [Candidatus Brocadiales bacterium]
MRDYLSGIKMSVVGVLGPIVVQLLCWSLRIEERPSGSSRRLFSEGSSRAIIAFWHATMLVLAYMGRGQGIRVLISQHTDGEYIARVIGNMGFGVVRGSSTRGGTRAMINMVREAEQGHFLAVTPDGPRGPREEAQSGIIFLAKKTGLPILPIGLGFSNCWRLPSWDGFRIPKPFSRVVLAFGEPITVPPELGEEELETYRQVLEKSLKGLSAEAEAAAVGRATGAS